MIRLVKYRTIRATFVNFEVWSMLSVLWLFYSLLLLYVQAKQSFTYPKCRLYLVSWPEMVWQPMRKKGQNGFFYQPKCKNQRLLSNLTHSDHNITHTLLFKLSLSRYIIYIKMTLSFKKPLDSHQQYSAVSPASSRFQWLSTY